MRIDKIRNFCIIAHIDHGKSTLADRLLQLTGAVSVREFRNQYLDANDIERERGITIKAKAISLKYTLDNEEYELNLIDTPGHVDFTYEVSRSLSACEGAVLVVDATQGVQAQTIANSYLAVESDLEIIPVINKIDMTLARVNDAMEEMKSSLGIEPENIILVSAKEGTNVDKLLEAIVKRIPHPVGSAQTQLQALIFDSVYDDYRGVIIYVRIKNGVLRKGDEIIMMNTGKAYKVEDVGRFNPKMFTVDELQAGQVGYIVAGIKNIKDVKIGDTITERDGVGVVQLLKGYKEPTPMVFCGIFPIGETDINNLRKALDRLSLNDSSFKYEPENSEALGFGFRCGFLGLLHMEIVQERLEREENVEVIQTAPNVTYELVVQYKDDKKVIHIDNPAKIPEENQIIEFREPIARVNIIIPSANIGAIMKLCEEKRGEYVRTDYFTGNRVMLTYEIPFAEMIFDFYDKMKSATRGYGTMDYAIIGYKAANLCKLHILVAGSEVDALSTVSHRDFAERRGRQIISILRKEIPRHLFLVALQASIGNRVIARESIKPFLKNVTGKCYGGDISRKRKLWDKQKEGKKKMKAVGRIEIPQSAFMSVLKADLE
ncbi:MAG: elongation factor 4 [Planctomycetes bacterium]|nr:elongation factor 4 [Planctomycetota bacterium]